MNELADVRRANLKAIIERDGLASASRRFQKPDRQLNDMAAGRKSFGEKVARAMERNYDAARTPGWLDLPPSDDPGHPTPALPEPSTPSDEDYALIPQYSARAACGPAYHNGHVEVRGGLAFKRDWLARMGLNPDNLSVIAAHGDSMAPTIQDGEVLLIDHSETEPIDGKVFALAREDEMVVKRLVRDFAGGWIVRSDNNDKARYGDFHVSDAVLRVVGRVVWRGGGL